MVRAEVAFGCEGVRVTFTGLKSTSTPGPSEAMPKRWTVPLNPFTPDIVMVELADPPGLIWKFDGFAERLKSCPMTCTTMVIFSNCVFVDALMFTL